NPMSSGATTGGSYYNESKVAAKQRENLDPKEFENDDSSPFDNVELQTIDEIKELNNIFQILNTNAPEARTEEAAAVVEQVEREKAMERKTPKENGPHLTNISKREECNNNFD